MNMNFGGSQYLPPLRSDLQIYPGGNDKYNSPTWVIHDPLSEKFYRIGWIEYEILCIWDLGTSEKICQIINQQSILSISDKNVEKLLNFMRAHHLLDFDNDDSGRNLYTEYLKIKAGRFKKFLQDYLFFRIPLLHPDKYLTKILPYIKPLISIKTLYFFIVLWLFGGYFVIRQWARFLEMYDYFFTAENMLLLTIVIIFTKIAHELGHAFATKYYNCKVATMGVALLVLFPVMYTDTTDSWRLPNRNHRIMIASAGMITEFALSGLAIFLWGIVPEGVFSSILIYIPTITLLSTILVNANPLLRYDGYHILSDLLSTDNLQSRASELASWKFRSVVLGIHDPQPVICSKRDLSLYLVYAYMIWIYRFFLYMSICLVVYYYFFKALGLFLMLVEIYIFMVMPVINEANVCYKRISEAKKTPRRTIVSLALLTGIIIMLFIPLQGKIEIPAASGYKYDSKIYAQHAGKIITINFNKGDKVKKGNVIAIMESPEINYQITKAKDELSIIETKIRQETGMGTKLGEKQVSDAELSDKQTALNSLLEEASKLVIKAPHDGEILNTSKSFKINSWLKNDDYLLSLADINSKVVIGYVREQDLNRLPANLSDIKGKMYFNKIASGPYEVKVTRIDNARNKYLDDPYFASIYKGDLLVFKNDKKTKRARDGEDFILNDSVYKITAVPANVTERFPEYVVRGKLDIYGEKTSIMSRTFKYVLAVLLRESGF